MSNVWQVLLGSLIGSVLALSGGVILLLNRRAAKTMAFYAAPFAAGTLLGAVFFDLLPDALETATSKQTILTFTVIGLISFYLLERFLHWFHHDHETHDTARPHTALFIIIGDTIHNAIDGIAIGASFLISPLTGFITSLAVAAHEVPQEVGDFSIMLKLGFSKTKAFLINLLSALTTTPVAIAVYYVGGGESFPLAQALGLTAGFFIYIAVADLIPRIHATAKPRLAEIESLLLISSVALVAIAVKIAERYISA